MKVLHVVRSNDDRIAQELIEEIGRLDGAEQTLLLIQDGVYLRQKSLRAFACSDDVVARGVETDVALVDYDQIIEMILGAERLITW